MTKLSKIVFLLIGLILVIQLPAQQAFNPNTVLIISKPDAKRPAVLRTGSKVRCELKSGEKIKGDLYVYNDHIKINNSAIQFNDIEFIKPVNNNVLKRQVGSIAFNEFLRIASDGERRSTLYWIRAGALTAVNFALSTKKYYPAQGWEFKVHEVQPFSFPLRD